MFWRGLATGFFTTIVLAGLLVAAFFVTYYVIRLL
jgi:hypothetical protein